MLEERKVDAAMAGITDLLTHDNGNGDTACPSNFVREGAIHDGSGDGLPLTISSQADWLKFVNDRRYSIYVVRKIDWCGNVVAQGGQFFAGCTRRNGGPVAVTASSLRSIVAGHEFGHGQGLWDNYQNSGLLMYYIATNNGLRVTGDECNSFLVGQVFPSLEPGAPPPLDDLPMPALEMAQADYPGTDITDLEQLLSGYWHTLPSDAIAALTPEQIEAVRDILRGEPSVMWQNAVTVLGLRGDPADTELLTKVISAGAAASEAERINGDVPWVEAQGNAGLALGMLYNRTQSPEALDEIYTMMVTPAAVLENGIVSPEVTEDVARNAAIAFEYAGEQAEEVYPDAQLQAELSSLLRNGVITEESPWSSLPLIADWQALAPQVEGSDSVADAIAKLDAGRDLNQTAGYIKPFEYQTIVEFTAPNMLPDIGNTKGLEHEQFFQSVEGIQQDLLTSPLGQFLEQSQGVGG